jgi:hypothetical protein
MFNSNVGDMPIDIFSDYISDILNQEWSWEYIGTTVSYSFAYRLDVYTGDGFGGYPMVYQTIYNRGNGYVGHKGYGLSFRGNGFASEGKF